MSGYCILRVAKIKSRASLIRAAQHNTRERQPSNADPDVKQPDGLKSVQAIMADYTAKLPAKVRKNAVHALEFVITMSPDSLTEKTAQKYLVASQEWICKHFGGSKNLNMLSVRLHYDEKTPHLHALVIPLYEGKLNAKHFVGGHRDRLKEMQDTFHKEVGLKFGLERGQPREETQARHVSIKEYYSKMDTLMQREREVEKAEREAGIQRIKENKTKKKSKQGELEF